MSTMPQASGHERIARAFDPGVLLRHLHARLQESTFNLDPMPHVVIDDVFPADVHRLLLDAIPPMAAFSSNDRGKQNYTPAADGSGLAEAVWSRIDAEWGEQCLVPAIMPLFRASLLDRYRSLFGDEHAAAAARDQVVRMGRLMLRRPGYRLKPHRDPLASAMTVLLYLTQAGDGARGYGTQLYRVRDDHWPERSQPHYPDAATCELAVDVPFRPNAALVFLNSLGGAHAAHIPETAPPTLERYSYQAYIGMPTDRLGRLLLALPAESRARWGDKYLPPA